MGKQLPLFGPVAPPGLGKTPELRHFVSESQSPPNDAHPWVSVALQVARRIEWVCDKCGTRAAPDSIGRMYFLRSPTDCEAKT